MTTTDHASAHQLPALQRIQEKLERAGARLSADNDGTPEAAFCAGLFSALLLVKDEIKVLNDSDDPPESVQVCYQAYQVVGSLLSDLGIFNTDAAVKILDNLSEARIVHTDVLPWDPVVHVDLASGLPELPIPAFPAVDTIDGNDKFTANQMRDYARDALTAQQVEREPLSPLDVPMTLPPPENLVAGQAQKLIGAMMGNGLIAADLPPEKDAVLWDVVKRHLRLVNREGARHCGIGKGQHHG